jgi:hypothetical protein
MFLFWIQTIEEKEVIEANTVEEEEEEEEAVDVVDEEEVVVKKKNFRVTQQFLSTISLLISIQLA